MTRHALSRLVRNRGPALLALATLTVALCLLGGLVRMSGYGERVVRVPEQAEFHVAVAVPPFPLPTESVYRRWDEMDGPAGTTIPVSYLPPALRSYGPMINDLTPAAIDLQPDLGDWLADLARLWGTASLMSGSGPSIFGLFSTREEADDAAAAVVGARAARGCSPTDVGWRELEEE